jgi:hypothetical protein
MSFFEDFIGHNVASAPLSDRPSFLSPTWSFTSGTAPELELVSEDGGSCCRLLSSNQTNHFVGLALGFPKAQARRHPVFGGRLMFRNDFTITNQQTWLGFSEVIPPTTNVADDFHGFFLENTGSLGNWKWVHRSNGAEANGDTGIVALQEFWYEFEVALTPTEAVFTLNGKVVQGIKRDASALDLYWLVVTNPTTGAAREVLLDLLHGSQDR